MCTFRVHVRCIRFGGGIFERVNFMGQRSSLRRSVDELIYRATRSKHVELVKKHQIPATVPRFCARLTQSEKKK